MNRDIYELIEKMIDKKVKGADTYINNGSRWLIFTDEKKWIFELTKEGTLWYNYYFFENIFKIISLNVVDNQRHITKWVENFIRNGVKDTGAGVLYLPYRVEDTIQNGVKNTAFGQGVGIQQVGDTIQNGVKHTDWCQIGTSTSIEDAIQNGVKHTTIRPVYLTLDVENTIQNGIKETKHNPFEDGLAMEEAIQNGVKDIKMGSYLWGKTVEDTIQNGVKETTPGGYLGFVSKKGKKIHQFESPKQNNEVEEVIKGGVKNTINHPARPQEVVDNTIKNGIKETKQEPSQRTWMSEQVINNGIKDTVCGVLEIYDPMTFEPVIKEMKRMNEVNIVLDGGIKETKTPNDQNFVDTLDFLDYNGSNSVPNIIDQVIQNGIKDTKELPDKSGELKGYGDYYSRQEDRTKPHTQYVDDVLCDGIKETKYCELHSLMRADHIIKYGIKETWGYEKQSQMIVNEVINKGEKQFGITTQLNYNLEKY